MTTRPIDPLEHPAEETLEDLVLGDLHRCRRVLLEAHLAFCSHCQQRVHELSRPAALVLTAEPTASVPGTLWDQLLARLDEQPPLSRDALAATPLPVAVRSELAPRSTPLDWVSKGDGAVALLDGDPAEEMALFLVRTPAERTFPYHVHLGGEELVILAGGLTDGQGHMATGDFRRYAAGSSHAPVMDPGEDCWAVALIHGGLAFEDPPQEAPPSDG